MNNFSWFKKEIPSLKKNEVFNLVLLITLPNIIFLLLSYFSLTARPLINLDYLLVLFFMLFPNRLVRFISFIALIFFMLFDVLMFIIQVFPFMDLAALRYLIPFVFVAPLKYIIIIFVFFILILLCSLVLLKITRKQEKIYSLLIVFIFIVFSYSAMMLGLTYHHFNGIMGRDNYYIASSQTLLYKEIIKSDFSKFANLTPELIDLKKNQPRAANNLKQPYSHKILYIVAESWGELRNKEAQKSVIQKILEEKENFNFINYGSFQTSGATVSGELRELCGLALKNNGFALSKTDKKAFSRCLPEILRLNGYYTVALHGTSGLLYDRNNWYPKAGFQKVLFGENFMDMPRCTAFKGVCDSALIKNVGNLFRDSNDKKIFFYWMTLTSHQPYSEKDIHNSRFDCKFFGMNTKGDACNNAKLETQFIDDLAQLVKKDEMRGVEVIVVGDHQPPVWGEEINYIKPLTVSYLHFKVK